MMIWVPLAPGVLGHVAEGLTISGIGFAATEAFCQAFGVDADAEETEYTLSWLATVTALRRGDPAVVAVARHPLVVSDDEFGRVPIRLEPSEITCWLTVDGPRPTWKQGLAALWDDPEVQAYVAANDLLWFGPEELRLVRELVGS